MPLLFILLAILLLGILITVHEFGHFIAARLTGITVKEFSIGFGPKILQWKSKKHETLFSLRPIPMGGYCMFYGDTDDDPNGEKKDDPRNYNLAPVWKRILSVACGPLMNFVLAFLVAIALMAAYGATATQPYIESVEAGMPAEAAGLMAGDQFLRIDGQDVQNGSASVVSEAIGVADGTSVLSITVLRDGQEVTLELTPAFDSAAGRYRAGIVISSSARALAAGEVLPAAWNSCIYASRAILDALGKLVTTGEGLNNTAGPVGVVQMVAEQTRLGGFEMFLNLMVIISINLGLVNLFPIPGLDGSRLVFMLIEAIRRKPISQRIEATVHMCGLVFLLGVIVFFTFRDVGRILGI